MQVVSSMVVGMFRVFMVILGTLLVDDPSWGRRSLLLFSVAGVTATKATLSLAEILPPEYHPECESALRLVCHAVSTATCVQGEERCLSPRAGKTPVATHTHTSRAVGRCSSTLGPTCVCAMKVPG
jgi:hypothetical protein